MRNAKLTNSNDERVLHEKVQVNTLKECTSHTQILGTTNIKAQFLGLANVALFTVFIKSISNV